MLPNERDIDELALNLVRQRASGRCILAIAHSLNLDHHTVQIITDEVRTADINHSPDEDCSGSYWKD